MPTTGTLDGGAVARVLAQRQPALVEYDGWRAIDRHERHTGKLAGRPRVKLTNIDDMLAAARPAASTR